MTSSPSAEFVPCRADHIGSLLRPQRVIEAREACDLGRIPAGELRAIEDECIREAVAMQESVGLQSITDGEFRRRTYVSDFIGGFGGIRATHGDMSVADRAGSLVKLTPAEYAKLIPSFSIAGKIRWERPILVDGFRYLAGLTSRRPKVTLPAPAQLHFYLAEREGVDAGIYPDIGEFWNDVVAAYRAEIRALAVAGCRFVQMDDTCFAKLCDPAVRERLAARGYTFESLIEQYASAIERIIADPPPGMVFGLHACRGSFMGLSGAAGGYEPIADVLFKRLQFRVYFLEFDTARAGDFSPLRHVPADRFVILGLVSTKLREIERPEDLKRRIVEASRHISIDRLGLSPQCGFSGAFKGHPLAMDDQKRKLEVVVKTAREIWPSG